ncbi:hypothetical protein MLD38_012738 [Melastoma candidum]|uniref:Uncharacterized protein n=1 Tax=Melastoma candidum TaxID=119954 RepID=A0ACB9R945_9MYRT|nr:hypothetical protein MLD38_012738 [Melastoma candidum]
MSHGFCWSGGQYIFSHLAKQRNPAKFQLVGSGLDVEGGHSWFCSLTKMAYWNQGIDQMSKLGKSDWISTWKHPSNVWNWLCPKPQTTLLSHTRVFVLSFFSLNGS